MGENERARKDTKEHEMPANPPWEQMTLWSE